MSKATPGGVTDRHNTGKRGTAPVPRNPRPPARPASTQDLTARIWDTLEWRRTLQAAVIIIVTGVTAALVLAGAALAAHAAASQTAAWTVAITITATVSYRAASRRRR